MHRAGALRSLHLVLVLFLVRAAAYGTETSPDSWNEIRHQTFEEVWATVYESYYDPTFGGVDWRQVGEKYRGQLGEVTDKHQLVVLLQQMLAELRRTHFAILPREATVFAPQERVRMGTVGVRLTSVRGQVTIAAVEAGKAAAAAGLKRGDRVVAVDNHDLGALHVLLENSELTAGRRGFLLLQHALSRLRAPVGTRVAVTVQTANQEPRTVELVCGETAGRWSEPIGSLPSVPVECWAIRNAEGVGYLRFSLFSPEIMKEIRSFITGLKPGDGLVLDLRGNPGGLAVMASGISGWLCPTEMSLGTMMLRQGQLALRVFPQPRLFAGPLAILIDNGSASTAEIFAAGLKEAGRARVFGEISAGAALPSAFKTLPSGDLFQYAVADLKTPKGTAIEGRGVEPDESVVSQPEDLAEGDPVMAAAQEWIEQARRGAQHERSSP